MDARRRTTLAAEGAAAYGAAEAVARGLSGRDRRGDARDPLTAAASVANLSCYGQRLRIPHPNPLAAGTSCEDIIGRLVEAYTRDRPANDAHFVAVHFKALMEEPLAAVEAIYAAAGVDLTPDVRAAMQGYVDTNAGKDRAPVEYGPADFGIDVPALRARCRGYYERFGVTPDPRYATG